MNTTRTNNEDKDNHLNTSEERTMRYVLICLAIILAMIMLMSGCATTTEYESYYEPVYVYKIKTVEHEIVHKPSPKRIIRYVYKSKPILKKRRVIKRRVIRYR